MIDTVTKAAPDGGKPTMNCSLAATVWSSAAITDLTRLRAQVAAAYPETLSAGVLKQTNEQNLPALLALKLALQQANLTAEQCQEWGVVAAPRMPGRSRVVETITKFRDQGAWSTSPHLIPNNSLHSPSGLFSQALRSHGPNLGVGGMRGNEGDALLAGMVLLLGERLPGVWIVITGWESESLDTAGIPCQVAVLGLRPRALTPHLPQLTFSPSASSQTTAAFSLELLGESIRLRRDASWTMSGAVWTVSYDEARREAAA